jgi:putative transcriptional regulator
MSKLSAKELREWESKRDIGAELVQAMREVKAAIRTGKVGKGLRVKYAEVPEIVEVRNRTGLSRQKFAEVLGVSARTLEGWEQGRRKPTGAAQSLLAIARRRPDVLREVFVGR